MLGAKQHCSHKVGSCSSVRAASMVNCSFHVWEVLWHSCQLPIAIQAQIPTNNYLGETFRDRFELIVTQAQIPTNNYLGEAFRDRFELIVCVCVRTAVGARFCKKELGGHFPKYVLHLTQSSYVLDGHPHFAPPCSGSWHR